MPQVTQHAVRIYGSAAYKEHESQNALQTRQIVLDPYSLDSSGTQGRALVNLGTPPAWVTEASALRRVVGRMFLGWFAGIPVPADSEKAIAEALQQFDATQQWQDSWYVTLVIEQDITVSDAAIIGNEYMWLDGDDIPVYTMAKTFQQIASPHLDRLAAMASTIVSPDAFEKVVLSDDIFFSAPGRKTFGWPKSRASFHAQVSRSLDSLDVEALEVRLREGISLPFDAFEWLKAVTPWGLAGLREQDAWRAFVQFYTGLELLHKRLVRRYHRHVVASERIITSDQAIRRNTPVLRFLFDTDGRNIRSRRDLHQRGEFAVLALALFPLQADADFETFETIKAVRDSVAHGDQTISETNFPLLELRTLFGRYLDAAIQEHLTPLSTTP